MRLVSHLAAPCSIARGQIMRLMRLVTNGRRYRGTSDAVIDASRKELRQPGIASPKWYTVGSDWLEKSAFYGRMGCVNENSGRRLHRLDLDGVPQVRRFRCAIERRWQTAKVHGTALEYPTNTTHTRILQDLIQRKPPSRSISQLAWRSQSRRQLSALKSG